MDLKCLYCGGVLNIYVADSLGIECLTCNAEWDSNGMLVCSPIK
jgi:ribosomal protein S27E